MKHDRLVARLLLLVGMLALLAGCDGGDWEYYAESPDDCFEDEVYDEEDQLCYPVDEWDAYYAESPEDCFEDEVYDEDAQLCYPAWDWECEGEECDEYEEYGDDDFVTIFFDIIDEFLFDQDWESEDFEFGAEEEILITYQVQGNRLMAPEEASLSDDSLLIYQEDTATHQKIWDYFADMIPSEDRTYLSEFVIFTDGVDGTMAAVEQDDDSAYEWVLAVDIADAGDPEELTYTLIHEYGHLLTLNPSQVEPDENIYAYPDDEAIYEAAAEACPHYFPGEGCSHADSYIHLFVAQFWDDIYDEWAELSYIEDDDVYYDAIEDFYYEYSDQFVTDYAATSPEEDIAEAWAHFILYPKPDGDTIAEEKVLFFYDWHELTRLRAEIVSRTYSRLRRR